MDRHGHRLDVPVPGVVATHLVLVEPRPLRCLEALLDRPPGTGDPDQVLVGGAGRAGAQVVRQLGFPTLWVPRTRSPSRPPARTRG